MYLVEMDNFVLQNNECYAELQHRWHDIHWCEWWCNSTWRFVEPVQGILTIHWHMKIYYVINVIDSGRQLEHCTVSQKSRPLWLLLHNFTNSQHL